MKQEVISYLSTESENLFKLNRFLHDNPEESYKEFKACEYISKFLEERSFKVTRNFSNIETSFYATKGDGYPKICFLCEYDAIKDQGHLTGHNLLTTISIASAIGLGNIIDKLCGTVIIIGCPGEYLGGTKSTLVRQGIFDDIDIVLSVHPDLVTHESGTSKAVIPLRVKFKGGKGFSFLNTNSYTALDGIILSFNILNSLLKGFNPDVTISSILSEGGITPLLMPTEAEAKFYIRAKDMDLAKLAEEKIKELSYYISNLMGLQYHAELYEPPNEQLLSNKTLNRLFINNLKENGITKISAVKDLDASLSLGSVSNILPCIEPHIDIIEDDLIQYGTKQFADATITDYAQQQAMKATYALIGTSIDLIESETLLTEVKEDFYISKKNLY